MTIIKTTKGGQVVTVENEWVLLDGQRVASEVVEISPWMMKQLDKKMPGHGMVYAADKVLFSAEDGLRAKTLIETYKAEQKALEDARAKAEFESLVASGVAFRTVQITEQYGSELLWARRFTEIEKADFSDWFKELGVSSLAAGGRVEIEREAVLSVIGDRVADAQFMGCSNRAWTITAAEWDEIIRLSKEIRNGKEVRLAAYEKSAAEDIQRKIETGYCFDCETWCHGDCGNYSPDPETRHHRELKTAIAEADYGINEG